MANSAVGVGSIGARGDTPIIVYIVSVRAHRTTSSARAFVTIRHTVIANSIVYPHSCTATRIARTSRQAEPVCAFAAFRGTRANITICATIFTDSIIGIRPSRARGEALTIIVAETCAACSTSRGARTDITMCYTILTNPAAVVSSIRTLGLAHAIVKGISVNAHRASRRPSTHVTVVNAISTTASAIGIMSPGATWKALAFVEDRESCTALRAPRGTSAQVAIVDAIAASCAVEVGRIGTAHALFIDKVGPTRAIRACCPGIEGIVARQAICDIAGHTSTIHSTKVSSRWTLVYARAIVYEPVGVLAISAR